MLGFDQIERNAEVNFEKWISGHAISSYAKIQDRQSDDAERHGHGGDADEGVVDEAVESEGGGGEVEQRDNASRDAAELPEAGGEQRERNPYQRPFGEAGDTDGVEHALRGLAEPCV